MTTTAGPGCRRGSGRAGHRRDDLRRLRRTGAGPAEQGGRRHRERQPFSERAYVSAATTISTPDLIGADLRGIRPCGAGPLCADPCLEQPPPPPLLQRPYVSAPRGRARRVAGLVRVRGPRDEETGQRGLGRGARDSSPRVIVVCSGMKAQPFQVAVNTSPQDGQAWLLVCWPGIHAPSNLLPQPGQSSGECSVILIPGRSSPPRPAGGRRGSSCRNRLAYHPVSGFRCGAGPLACMM